VAVGFKWRSGVSAPGRCAFISGKIDMSKGRQTFRRSELTRAIKAALAAGVDVARAEIEPSGKIVIVICKSGASSTDLVSEWDGAE
jgi:hypothetical protein